MRKRKRKTKPPIFRGILKGYSAIFLGEYDRSEDFDNRFRILTSQGKWYFFYPESEGSILEDIYAHYNVSPCWYSEQDSLKEQIKKMKIYDVHDGRKTIFLGYVKDTE